ncbi:MAG: acyltransferase, partial [Bacteroidetes bacterium]|nr:acyltransferase [Bacteroidota bacterium]
MAKLIISNSKIYFPNLDGLRFAAFLMVYLQHGFFNSIKALDINGTFYEKLISVLCNGGIGVSIFFVLSGFLITYLILVESDLNGKLNVGYFYIRRTLRIWPLYFAVIIFVFLLYPYFKGLYGIAENTCNIPGYYFFFLSNFDVINIQKYHPGLDSLSG